MKRSPETKEEQERQCLIDTASKREEEKTLVVQACKELVRVFGIVRRHLPIYLFIVPLRTLSLSLSLSLSISTISVPIYAVLRQVTGEKIQTESWALSPWTSRYCLVIWHGYLWTTVSSLPFARKIAVQLSGNTHTGWHLRRKVFGAQGGTLKAVLKSRLVVQSPIFTQVTLYNISNTKIYCAIKQAEWKWKYETIYK